MEKKTLLQKINDIHKQIDSVVKDDEVAVTERSSYQAVSHDAVTKLLHQPLAKIGIVAVPTQTACNVTSFEKTKYYSGKEEKVLQYMATVTARVTFINADDKNDTLISEATAYALDSGDKAANKAYSMAVKMIQMKVFMLESKDAEEARDEDGATYKKVADSGPAKPTNYAPNRGGVSEAQIKRMYAIGQKNGFSGPSVVEEMKKVTGVDNPSKLDYKLYEKICAHLENSKHDDIPF